MKNLPDNSLWFSFISGNDASFTILFKRYYPYLHNYGLKLCGNINLTEDSLQEFFLYLYEKRNSLSAIHNFKTYLFVSYRRKLLESIKKTTEQQYVDIENVYVSDIEFSHEEIMIQKEFTAIKAKKLADILNNLSARQKEIIYLKYYSDLSNAQIAEVTGLNYQSVLNTLQKAFLKIRKAYEATLVAKILEN